MATGKLTGLICGRCDMAELRERDGKYSCSYCLHTEDVPAWSTRQRDTTPCPAPSPAPHAPAAYPPGYVAGPWGFPVKLSMGEWMTPELEVIERLRASMATKLAELAYDKPPFEKRELSLDELDGLLRNWIYSRDTRGGSGDEIVGPCSTAGDGVTLTLNAPNLVWTEAEKGQLIEAMVSAAKREGRVK